MKIYLGTTGSKDQKETLDKMGITNRLLSFHRISKKKGFLKDYIESANKALNDREEK
jgi:hypothetical protein